jgi:hypothetical protein
MKTETETENQTVNHGIISPIARSDVIHGVFDKASGKLISFTATNFGCTIDFTSKLLPAQIAICKKSLQDSYNCRIKAKQNA